MAQGIKTGGRQKGSKNLKQKEVREKIVASGLTPLEYMMKILRDSKQTLEVRLEAAKSAAPYVHPKLTATEHSGSIAVSHEDAINALG